MRHSSRRWWCTTLVVVAVAGAVARAQVPTAPTSTLDYVVYLGRHGARTPLLSQDLLDSYSVKAWPRWRDPLGNLTTRGRETSAATGREAAAYLRARRLLGGQPCDDATRTFVWTDNIQRDIETARAMAQTMFPGCRVPLHMAPAGTRDPLFEPLPTIPGSDLALAGAAMAGRFGGRSESLLEAFPDTVEQLRRLLRGCSPSRPCPAGTPEAKYEVPGRLAPAPPGAGRPDVVELFQALIEAFSLEYLDGMSGRDLGWGHLTPGELTNLMAVRGVIINAYWRTPYLARARGSALASHVLRSMQQVATGVATTGTLGSPSDRLLLVMGHDSDFYFLGSMLDLHWLTPGYPPDSTPPNMALTFELWRDPAGHRTVRAVVTTQRPDSLRAGAPDRPPDRVPVFIPGCSVAGEGYPCDWDTFQRILGAAFDPAFVRPVVEGPPQ